MSVRLYETDLYGQWLYRIFVNDVKYDEFVSKRSLTFSQQQDVTRGYAEGLDMLDELY